MRGNFDVAGIILEVENIKSMYDLAGSSGELAIVADRGADICQEICNHSHCFDPDLLGEAEFYLQNYNATNDFFSLVKLSDDFAGICDYIAEYSSAIAI